MKISKAMMVGGALVLSAAVLPAHAERLKRVELPIDMTVMDTDKDGKLSKMEASNSPFLADDFPARDANKDGFLDKTELMAKASDDAPVGGPAMNGKGGNTSGSAGGGGEGGSSGSSAAGGGS